MKALLNDVAIAGRLQSILINASDRAHSDLPNVSQELARALVHHTHPTLDSFSAFEKGIKDCSYMMNPSSGTIYARR